LFIKADLSLKFLIERYTEYTDQFPKSHRSMSWPNHTLTIRELYEREWPEIRTKKSKRIRDSAISKFSGEC